MAADADDPRAKAPRARATDATLADTAAASADTIEAERRHGEIAAADTVATGGGATGARADTAPGAAPPRTIGRYQLSARLGAGAMGEVWTAFDPQLERKLAIKLLHPRRAEDPEASVRMLREARAMAKLSHRAVVAIHDAGEIDGRIFLAMELVRGRTLGAHLRERTPEQRRDWRRYLAMLCEAGRGLEAAHAAGILHRDFKPDNVLVDEDGRVCVGDFGLATRGAAPRRRPSAAEMTSSDDDLDLTTTGSILGTPAYMSLEQLEGREVDARADQFSFCVAVYEALYGYRPFEQPGQAATVASLAVAIANGDIRQPPADAGVPSNVRAIVVRGLAAEPDARWPDMTSLLAALDAALRASAPGRRRRRARLAVVALAAAAAAGGVVWIVPKLGSHAGSSLADSGLQSASSGTLTAHRLEPARMRAVYALSPGGRLAVAFDRVDVRDLATGQTWTSSLGGSKWVQHIQFESDDVVMWSPHDHNGEMYRWDLTSPPVLHRMPPNTRWLARTAHGDIVSRKIEGTLEGPKEIALVRDGSIVWSRKTLARTIDFAPVTPDGRRFAYLELLDRFRGRVIVFDGTRTLETEMLDDPVAITWRDNATLLYATGAPDSSIYAMAVSDHIGPPRRIFRVPVGAAGRVLAGRDRMMYVAHQNISRARLVDRATRRLRDYETSVAAGPLGWHDDHTFWAWTGADGQLERTSAGSAPSQRLGHALGGEPANATFAGDVLIAALRGPTGRRVAGFAMGSGDKLWELPAGASLVVRCAADRAPPCFSAHRTSEATEVFEIVPIDPATGAVTGAAVYRGSLEDFAVHESGTRLLVGGLRDQVEDIDLASGARTTTKLPLVIARSLAYEPGGPGFFAAGTAPGATYAVGVFDGESFTTLSQSDSEMLSIVRPSPDGSAILVLGRSFGAELWDVRTED